MKAVKYLVAVVIKPFTNLKNLKRAWAFSFFKFLIGYNSLISETKVYLK